MSNKRSGRYPFVKMQNGNENFSEAGVSENLDTNESALRIIFANCSDFTVRRFLAFDSITCMAVFLEVLVDDQVWGEELLAPLMKEEPVQLDRHANLVDLVTYKLPSIIQLSKIENLNEAVLRISKGQVVLFIESSKQAIAFQIKDNLKRQLEEPSTEAVIRGPRIGFIEQLEVNMALLRHQIQSPRLKMVKMAVGNISRTDVTVAYIENMAAQDVIDEVKRRLSSIEIDSVLETGYIEETISDHPHSPFPLIQTTQRPDTVAAALLEGKVAILVNGSPMVLVAPITIWYGFQSVEDYYISFIFATMLRWLRYLFTFIALALPSLYVAVTTFHQEMIPTPLALSLAAAREVVPFPAMLETLIMEVTFEALREAGVRLPRPVGQTISIVGALVIGQAAVQAGIISAPIIIVVSLTGIASFLIPNPSMSLAVSILRFPMVIAAGMFGLYGVGAAMLAILIHLTSMSSFGVPYLSPIAPFDIAGIRDVLIRAPWKAMKKRQQYMRQKLELDKK
ncbi:spore germination protein [Paenibacillus alkalitolerans]|uniref:spore germination protein n=1 Tax=Paenibacillus alkalitolerans TaxID=2799335 RepID=UPI0018F769DB|nr:spore germination protein [Paenibacillus alkalitolerans]